jgi:N-acetyl-1-D-myo-inositol-2-amino-2-deoxy-alpha-D-glucopyranoside deacetylase
MGSQKTLLVFFAHPDDEAFGTGGTLARYAAEGVQVKLICATRGESGKITDPGIDSASDVGVLREQELRDACHALGLEPPTFLDYRDSGRQERVRQHDSKALMNIP